MDIFNFEGDDKFDFCTVNGSPDFAIIPAGFIPGIDIDAPIRLQVGNNQSFGFKHITFKHGWWLEKHNACAASMLYRKLKQSGPVFKSLKNNNVSILLKVLPSALIVLRWESKRKFFSVTTIYERKEPDHDSEPLNIRYTGHIFAC